MQRASKLTILSLHYDRQGTLWSVKLCTSSGAKRSKKNAERLGMTVREVSVEHLEMIRS